MPGEAQVFDPVEPLQESGISLLPRTIRASTGVPLPSDPNNPEAVHDFMKSEVLDCPERAMDEAGIILDKGTTELLNTKLGDFLESLGIDKNDLALEGKEKPRQRREGLGRKRRAQFSLKPVMSQPSENLEPNLDINQLQDPAEFFAAYEKLEYARKEIQILKGETSNLSDYDPSNKRRDRRPGILGKSANYKHRYSSTITEGEDMHTSTQESLADDALASQGHDKLRPETNPPNPEQEEIDVEGSLIETENKVSEILDELLSKDNEDLNGDGALNLLQERLQMKPIDLGDLSIPDFHDIGRTNFKALAERLPKTRKSSSNIGSLAKKSLGGTPKNFKQGIASPTNLIGSPTPPKSPFASISLLKKRSSQSDTQRDPFLPLNVDFSEQRNSYLCTNIDKESHQASASELNMSGKLRQDTEDGAGGSQVSDTDIQRAGCVGVILSALDKNINQLVTDTDFSPHRSQNMTEQRSEMNPHELDLRQDTEDGAGGSQVSDTDIQKAGCVGVILSALDKNINQQVTDTDFSPHRSQDMMEQRSEMNPHGKTDVSDISEGQEETERDSSPMLADNLDEMHSKEGFPAHQAAKVQESGNMDLLNESRPLTDEVTRVAAEDNHINTPSNVAEMNAEQNLQEQHCKTKRPRGGLRVNKAHPLRPSLAAAGTSFESGVRRSKRIKTRPLEYWKGERLLYGRVDESIKLIGMKYISPAKGGGKLKVKSYVPDEYKKILELAAAH